MNSYYATICSLWHLNAYILNSKLCALVKQPTPFTVRMALTRGGWAEEVLRQ